MIVVVDYGIGNLGSVLKGLRKVGAEVLLSGDPAVLRSADAVVLPGDGAFGSAMEELRRRGLLQALRDTVAQGRPLLGICLGMQLLFEESEEHGCHQGLGLLAGRVRRLDPGEGLPVPHMGWNRLSKKQDHWLLRGVEEGAYVYFVHSYHCDAAPGLVIAAAEYGSDIAAIVGRGALLGVQFHPEKSQTVGLTIIENFVGFCRGQVAA